MLATKTYKGFTDEQLSELMEAITQNYETSYQITGPRSLAKAVERYSDSCTHYCLSTIEYFITLTKQCSELSVKEAQDLVDRAMNPEREDEWDDYSILEGAI